MSPAAGAVGPALAACAGRGIPTWPGIPVPGQALAGPSLPGAGALAGLRPSGTGALAGLPRGPACPGLLRLTVPWRTLAGIIAEPGQLSRFGPVTPQAARYLADAASRDASTEWRVIVTDDGGRAIAVARIRRSRARSAGLLPVAGLVSQVTLVVPGNLARAASLPAPGDPAACATMQTWSPAQPSATRASPNPAGSASSNLSDMLAAALDAARQAIARATPIPAAPATPAAPAAPRAPAPADAPTTGPARPTGHHHGSANLSQPGTRPAAPRHAASPPTAPTSITPFPMTRADGPATAISAPAAGPTIASSSAPAGTSPSPSQAPSSGPPQPDAPTPKPPIRTTPEAVVGAAMDPGSRSVVGVAGRLRSGPG